MYNEIGPLKLIPDCIVNEAITAREGLGDFSVSNLPFFVLCIISLKIRHLGWWGVVDKINARSTQENCVNIQTVKYHMLLMFFS